MNSIIKGRVSKLVVVVVAIGLLLQPVHQVLAAEESLATSGPTAPESVKVDPIVVTGEPVEQITSPEVESETGIVDGEDDVKDPSEEVKDVEEVEEPEEEAETSQNGIPLPPSEPVVQLPPSTIKQKTADADVASGALVYNYALQTPKGRAGLQPELSLSYNSQQNEEGSVVGYGWGLGIPAIERKNVNGVNLLYEEEHFTSSLSGDLKKISSSGGVSVFGAKIDNGSYLKYSFNSAQNIWTVHDKSGMAYSFGQTTESRLSNPNDTTEVFSWYLTKAQDTKGNFVLYEYVKVDNQVYPSVIRYTGNGTDQGIFKVQFNLEDRTDKAMSAKYGFMVTNSKRIDNIEVMVQNTVIGRYDLSYAQQSVNRRSQLEGVQYTGFDAAGANGITDGATEFAYESIAATDLLSKIIQNTGGVTNINYKSSALFRDINGEALNPNLPFALQVVESIEYDDRNGVTWGNEFEYAGGWFYYNGPMDRRFVGFEKVTRTDSVGNKLATFYHQGNTTNSAYGESTDDWAKAGKSYKSELRDAQGNLFTQVLNKWEYDRLSGVGGSDDRSFAKLAQTIVRTFDGNTTHKDTASTYSYDEDTGNLISGVDFGEVIATDSGTFTDAGTDKITTNVSYATPTGDVNMTGLVSGFIELNNSGTKVKEQKSYYDSLGFGEVGIGNTTKEESWISGSTYAAVNRTYNSFGLPLTETDPRNNTTTYSYDSFNLYPIIVTNALSHVTNLEYDYRLGQANKTTDSNGLVNKISFDGLGRATKEELTNPGQSDPNVLFTKKSVVFELYQEGGETRGWKTVQTNYLDEINTPTPRENKSVTYTDGFDRIIQTRTLVESANGSSDPRYSVADTTYNSIAQVEKTSLPYFSISDARTALSTDNNLFTTMSYDAAYRVVSLANVLGSTTNEYDDWKVTVTDANGKIKGLEKDAFDRLIEVDEHNLTEIYETKYTYDAVGNLIKITDAQGNFRNFTYDGLGRRTQAQDLRKVGDTVYGTWNYVYDNSGNLTRRTDPKGVNVGYIYDQLNRITSENANEDGSVEVTYTYDSCLKGIGRLCGVVNSELTNANEYNVLGQLTKETKTINSQSYVSEYSYDRQGNQLGIKNPDNSEVKNVYNIGGVLEAVQQKEVGGKFGNIVVDVDYAPTGAVIYLEQINGAKTTNTYDTTKLYRLVQKVGTVPASGGGVNTVQNYSYTYDAVGNITRIVDTSSLNSAKTVDYTYDDLHRLVNATSTNAANSQNFDIDYQYDSIGNILYRSDAGTYSYNGHIGKNHANPHAVTSVTYDSTTVNLTYDKNGNMLTNGANIYTWDYNNRLISTVYDGIAPIPATYGYDAGGMRVRMTDRNGVVNVYPSQSYNTSGSVSGASVQKHIFAGEGLVATIKGSGSGASKSFAHSDHLGSTSVVSDMAGAVTESLDYYPFGNLSASNLASGTTEQRKYIGQEYDPETQLSYLEARYYRADLGRFLSQDAVHLSLGDPNAIKAISGLELQQLLMDPQSFNSYGYARNNPIGLKDPNGEFWGKVTEYLSKAGYAVSNAFQKQYQQTSWTSPLTKTGSYLLADAFKQQGVALDKNAPISDRVIAGTLIASNAVPGPKGVGKVVVSPLKETILLERAAMIGRAASTGDPEVLKIVEKLYQASDDVIGGTAGALIHEKNTGEMLSKSATGHFQAAHDRVNWINNQLSRIGNTNQNATQLLNSLRQDLERAIYHKK